MKISDELREWADVHCDEECEECLGLLADRIDREMVELPKDADGEPICVGDTVYYLNSGFQAKVLALSLDCKWHLTTNKANVYNTRLVTHERPDSLERIADELEKWFDKLDTWSDGVYVDKNACPELREFADRIRKLATKEDK